jgi:CSLREA domain-containing protein
VKLLTFLIRILFLLTLIITLEPYQPPTHAEAATFTVDTLVDESDGDYSSGDFSLREAVEQANAAGGADIINFDASIAGGTITLGSQLDVTDDLTINGSGITLDGGSATPIMKVGSIATVTINDLTFQNGSDNSGFGGGAIYNAGTLMITNSTFSGNSATSIGGAISNFDGTLTITTSTFSGNSAGDGGAIMSFGPSSAAMITSSSFTGNTANSFGGAISSYSGTLTITNSTFSDNTAASNGGAINNSGTLTIANSTFSDNTANNFGGAIFTDGTLTITNSTFSGNSANNLGGTLYHASGIINVTSTLIVSGSCSGTITDQGNNLRFNATSCPGTEADPQLGPLQNNGGSTDTMLPALTSPAVDAYFTPCATSTDQRDVSRPQGFCDIGATEQNGNTTPLAASAACNGPNLDVIITAGDEPFNITAGAGINTPVSGVNVGTTTINGPEKWDDLTVTETAGNSQAVNLGQYKCRTDERPVPIAPLHRSRTTEPFPAFAWTPVSFANNYRVFVFDDKVAANRTVDIRQNSGGPTTMQLSTPLPNGRLFWRVRGRTNRVWGLWSVRFTLFKDPVAPLTVSTPAPTIDLNAPSGENPAPTQVPTVAPASTVPSPPNSR